MVVHGIALEAANLLGFGVSNCSAWALPASTGAPERLAFDVGVALEPGPLCWRASDTGQSVSLGELTVRGPAPGAWACTLGEVCVLMLAGQDLPDRARIRLVTNDCASADAEENAAWDGFTNPSYGNGHTTNPVYLLGTALAGPGTATVCWSPGGAAGFRDFGGRFALLGPRPGNFSCTLGHGQLPEPSARECNGKREWSGAKAVHLQRVTL